MSSTIPVQPPGQPQSKAAPVAQLTAPAGAQPDGDVVAEPVEPPRVRTARPVKEPNSIDPASLPSTLALIQKVLTPDKNVITQTDPSAIEDILPPLTSSNDVDIELYAILAVVVKDFVNTWYTKITLDRGFVEEISHIIAHCSRALEQRLRRVDIAALVLDEIPLLVQAHIETYRTAKTASVTSPYQPTIRHIYYELNPHPALTPLPCHQDPSSHQIQEKNERTYRQLLVQGSLAILLPTEDLQNGPLRVLVGDIIADLIVGQALAGKVCEGWFLHDAIFKVSEILDTKLRPKTTGSELRDDAKNRLEKFGLLASDSNAQRSHSSTNDQSKIIAWFWRIMQYGYLMYIFLRCCLRELQAVRRKPKRQQMARFSPLSPVVSEDGKSRTPSSDDQLPRPVLAFGVYGTISTLLKVAERMPWVASMLIFLQHVLLVGTGQVGELNSVLDRFLYHAIQTHILPPSLLPTVLRNLRIALFPNNSMGPPAPPSPSVDERWAIKRKAAESLRGLMPAFVARKYYATNDNEMIVDDIVEDILDPLDDIYLNKHLMYAILELILVKLIPELGEQPISELLAERGVDWENASIFEDGGSDKDGKET